MQCHQDLQIMETNKILMEFWRKMRNIDKYSITFKAGTMKLLWTDNFFRCTGCTQSHLVTCISSILLSWVHHRFLWSMFATPISINTAVAPAQWDSIEMYFLISINYSGVQKIRLKTSNWAWQSHHDTLWYVQTDLVSDFRPHKSQSDN